jgi:4-hydroxy-4-methyl-2-oxoglutarate aldolase
MSESTEQISTAGEQTSRRAAVLDADISDLARLGVAHTYEAAARRGLVDMPLIQILPGSRVAGPARTVRCGQDDNMAIHAAIEYFQPGEIAVIVMPESRPVALVGDGIVTMLQQRGVVGVLVNSAVRDVDSLIKLGMPVWSSYVRCRGAKRADFGAHDVPVVLGGASIEPGDIVVLDSDGSVVVSRSETAKVAAAARALAEREADLFVQFRAGVLSMDLLGLRPS